MYKKSTAYQLKLCFARFNFEIPFKIDDRNLRTFRLSALSQLRFSMNLLAGLLEAESMYALSGVCEIMTSPPGGHFSSAGHNKKQLE